MTQEKLPIREKLAYGCGDFAGKNFFNFFALVGLQAHNAAKTLFGAGG